MIKKQIFAFILRWIVLSLGMYLCMTTLGLITASSEAQATFKEPWMLYVVAGLIFSLVNSIVKPLIKMLALPLAILTMGISTLIINTAMVILTVLILQNIVPGIEITFLNAFIASIVLSLINTVLNLLI